MNTIDKITEALEGLLPSDVVSLRLQFLSNDRNYLQGKDSDGNVVWVISVNIVKENGEYVFSFEYEDYKYFIGESIERLAVK